MSQGLLSQEVTGDLVTQEFQPLGVDDQARWQGGRTAKWEEYTNKRPVPTCVVLTEGSQVGWKFLALAAMAPQAGSLPTNHWAVTVFSQAF